MFIDIAIPSGNEEKFIEVAKKLDTKELIFLYEDKKNMEKANLSDSEDFKIYTGLIVQKNNIQKGKQDFNFAPAKRQFFENKHLDYVFEAEQEEKKDHLHYRKSGLNQIRCNLANKKEIIIGFSFNQLLKENNKEIILGRMMQNAKLCRKYGCEAKIASFARNPYELRYRKDLIAFGQEIGLTHKEAKQAVMHRKL